MENVFRKLPQHAVRYVSFLHVSADEGIRRETYRVNLHRLVLIGPLFFVIELSLLPLEHYLLDVGNILLIFLCANVIVYPFVYFVARHQQRMSERVIRLATYVYLLTIIGLGTGLSLKGLMVTDLVHVYLMTVVAVSIFFIIPAVDHIVIILIAMIPYLLIYPHVLLHQEIRFVILNNVVVFSIMSWLLGRMVYSVTIQMFKDREKLEHQNILLSELARKDPMTGLLNRGALQELVWSTVREVQEKGRTCSIILFDIDNFKSVNDTYGHLTGDNVIRQISRITLDLIGKEGMVGRYGGDEFLVILPEASMNRASVIAEALWAAVETMPRNEVSLPVTLSGGVISCRCESVLSIEQIATHIIKRADENLFKAKAGGKNQFVSETIMSV